MATTDNYQVPWWASILHSFPHLDLTFRSTESTFQPKDQRYLEVSTYTPLCVRTLVNRKQALTGRAARVNYTRGNLNNELSTDGDFASVSLDLVVVVAVSLTSALRMAPVADLSS